MIQKVKIGRWFLYADDASEVPEDRRDSTGLKMLQNGLNYEIHIRRELERLIPNARGFMDIGANVGMHTISAKTIRDDLPCIAIEASQENSQLLLRTIMENHIQNVTVLNVVVADQPRIIQINKNWQNHCCTRLNEWPPGVGNEHADWEYRFAFPLDFFKLPPVDVIKMDIEGFEYLALEGGKGFIMEHRPNIIFEYYPDGAKRSGVSHLDLLNWFLLRGYKLTVLDYVPGTRKTFLDAEECHNYVVSVSKWISDILAEPA